MHPLTRPRNILPLPSGAALAFIAVAIGNVALAFGPWFVRAADVGPVAAGFWRLALGAPVLFAIVLAVEGNPVPQMRRAGWVPIAAGIAFAADLAAWHIGIVRTTLANATLFGNSAILMFPIWGFLVARAWPTRQQGLALALAAAGAALLLGQSYQLSPQNLIGDLFCLLAGTLYTVYFILMARARGAMRPLPALALCSLSGALPLLVLALALGEPVWPRNWGIVIALALASQVIGQGLIIYAIAHLSPLVMGIALLLQPIVAASVGWIAYGERLGPADFVGAVLVAAALVLVRRGSGRVASAASTVKSET